MRAVLPHQVRSIFKRKCFYRLRHATSMPRPMRERVVGGTVSTSGALQVVLKRFYRHTILIKPTTSHIDIAIHAVMGQANTRIVRHRSSASPTQEYQPSQREQ